MPQPQKVYDYTIIGAGVAGLAVAALLAKDGFQVKLIESLYNVKIIYSYINL